MHDLLLGLIIGTIEGITEFLPISSTGHLIIFQNLTDTPQPELFNVVIQVAALLAIIPLFWPQISKMIQFKEPNSKDLFIKTSVAFVITAVVGLVAKKLGLELPESALPIAWALFIGGVLFVILERRMKGKTTTADITWTIVLVAALGQIIAMVFPGASRSGSTIILMLLVGLNREKATEFSFLLGIPTMLAAGGYEIVDAIKEGSIADELNLLLVTTSIVSAIAAFISVKWLLGYIKHHSFASFGYYRILLGSTLFLLIALGITH